MEYQNKAIQVRKQTVYLFVIVLHPTVEEAEKGKTTEVLVPMGTIVADGDQHAVVLAGRKIPEEYVSDGSRVEVLVRPF